MKDELAQMIKEISSYSDLVLVSVYRGLPKTYENMGVSGEDADEVLAAIRKEVNKRNLYIDE